MSENMSLSTYADLVGRRVVLHEMRAEDPLPLEHLECSR